MTIPRTSAPHHAAGPRAARRTTVLLATTALVAAGALAGCTSKEVTKSTETTTSVPSVTAPPLPKEPTFAGKPAGAAVDVKVVECPTDAGTRTAKLELTNSSKKARDYAVMVIWLKNDSGTPLGSALVTRKAAAPGKKIPLAVKAKVVAKADRCVLNVKAGSLK